MSEATIITEHMRGGCATVGATVHTLFRVTSSRKCVAPARRNDGSTLDHDVSDHDVVAATEANIAVCP